MGGSSAASRDRQMVGLIDAYMPQAYAGAVIEKNCPKEDMSRFRCGDVLGYLMPVRVE